MVEILWNHMKYYRIIWSIAPHWWFVIKVKLKKDFGAQCTAQEWFDFDQETITSLEWFDFDQEIITTLEWFNLAKKELLLWSGLILTNKELLLWIGLILAKR